MAISLSDLQHQVAGQSVADRLAGQSEDLQETPWWKTAGSILLPLLATAVMPGIGTLLASAGGALGGLGAGATSIGGQALATGAKGLGALTKLLGTGLQYGKAATGASKFTKALHLLKGAAAKSAFNVGTSKLTGGILDKIEGKSVQDLNLEGLSPYAQAIGGKALGQMRKGYTQAKSQADTTNLTASIMAGIMQQGGGDLAGAIKNIWSKGGAAAGGMSEGAKQSLMQRLMPIKSNVFQPVGQRTALDKLTGGLLPSSLPGVAPRVSQNVLSELMRTVPIEKTIFDPLGKAMGTAAEQSPVIGMGAERYGKSIMDELLSLSQYDFGGYSPGKYIPITR